MKSFVVALLLLFVPVAYGQIGPTAAACQSGNCQGFGPPIGACGNAATYVYTNIAQTPPVQYACQAKTWVALGSGAAGGGLNATATVVLAASNSPEKANANVVCSGTNDDQCINNAITTYCTPGLACKVFLHYGIYNLSGAVNITQSDLTLTGEGHCMWGGYSNPWYGTQQPAGFLGNSCSQLKASAPGFNLINIYGSDGGENRIRGIEVSKLYLVGSNYQNGGIYSTNFSDNSLFEDNILQRLNVGMDMSMDSPIIRGNSIQDIAGDGIRIAGVLSSVTQNLIFDIGGKCIVSTANSAGIAGNRMGDCSGIDLSGAHARLNGNSMGGFSGPIRVLDGSRGIKIVGNNIDFATTAFGFGFNYNYSYTHAVGQTNLIDDLVYVGNAASVDVSGNTFDFSNKALTGYIISAAYSTNSTYHDNLVIGGTAGSAVNGAYNTLSFRGGGSSNMAANNSAVALPTLAAGPAAITSASLLSWMKADSFAGGNIPDGTNVLAWSDQSGNAFEQLGNNPAYPVFKASSLVNGKPGLRFSGAYPSYTFSPNFVAPNSQAKTIFVVFAIPQTASTVGSNISIINAGSLGQTNALAIDRNSNNLLAYAGNLVVTTGTTIAANTPYVVELSVNGASSYFSLNGTKTATFNPGAQVWINQMVIGANAPQNGEWFPGDISEVAVYAGQANATDAGSVGAALCFKYGITCNNAW